LRISIGAALLGYLAHSGAIDLRALPKLVQHWPVSAAAVTIFLLDLTLMALRLCLLFRPQGMRLPYGASLQLTLVGSFFALFLPGRAGGDVARVFYASKAHVARRAQIVCVLLFDRVLGLFSLLLLPLLFAPIFGALLREPVLRTLLLACALIAGAMVTAFLLYPLAPRLLRRLTLGRVRSAGLTRLVDIPAMTIGAYLRSPGTLAVALCIALADNLVVVAVTALAVGIVDPASLSSKLCLIVPMGEIVNSLPLTPGGLGVGEAAFDALFKIVGLHGGAQALLYWRIWNILASLVGLPFYLRGFRGRVLDIDDAG
jgi:uncharacterized membrane protein YbhN (UPF0104 family)